MNIYPKGQALFDSRLPNEYYEGPNDADDAGIVFRSNGHAHYCMCQDCRQIEKEEGK